jgi:hypothetical protein
MPITIRPARVPIKNPIHRRSPCADHLGSFKVCTLDDFLRWSAVARSSVRVKA